jgi:hypothetical protein
MPQVLDPLRAYHIEVHWLLCSARNVGEFVQTLLRRGQNLGLSLTTIPEYSRSTNLNVHPFIAHPFIALAPPSLVRVCEESLLLRFDFVADDERQTDWKELGVEESSALSQSLEGSRWAWGIMVAWFLAIIAVHYQVHGYRGRELERDDVDSLAVTTRRSHV